MRLLANTHIDFLRWRWHALVLSSVVLLAGVVTIVARGGLPLGIDFSGGTVVQLQFSEPITVEAVRDALGGLGTNAVVQRSGAAADNVIMVRLPLSDDPEQQDLDAGTSRVEAAVAAAGLPVMSPPLSTAIVGPVVGSDLRRKGIAATLTALGGILLYLAFRFRFTFAVGAVVATFHDLLITLVMLTWFGYDISLNVIAAILAIAGYSVNDTIVIYDRVRENQRARRREDLTTIVNASVNQTLGRTLITSGTTFVAVLALFLFGGEVLQGFAFTMLVGVITGTYSSIFIAAAIAIVLNRRSQPQVQAQSGRTEPARRRARG